MNCNNQGNSWLNAFKYLQDALAAAAANPPGDEIWVRAGEYFVDQDCANPDGTGLRTATFDLVEGVELYGGFDGTETLLIQRDPLNNITILSGEVAPPDPPDPPCGDPGAGDCFSANGTPGCDDGLCCEFVCSIVPDCCTGPWDAFCAQLANENCPIGDNAYHVVTATNVSVATILDGFEITGGFADGTAPTSRGGGMLILSFGGPAIVRCTFIDNYALEGGGLSGSPDFGLVTTPLIVNCQFLQNIARDNGGGAHAVRSALDFVNCLFAGNIAERTDGGGLFAGVSGGGTSSQVVNCTFTDNHAPNGEGGGIFTQDIQDPNIFAKVINSTLWGNTHSGAGDETEQVFGPAEVTYSCVQDEAPGDGNPPFSESTNIDLDPLFVDAANGNYRVHADSPCIDSGNPDQAVIPADTFDVDQDTFTDEPTPDLDLGDERVVGGTVDMGAYESVPCPWDIDGDCMVGAADLLDLLFNWGPCPGCAADFDGDDIVGASDLLALLFNWGPCQCDPTAVVPSLEDEMAAHCLTMDDWDDFEEVMTNPQSSQEDKDNYLCWMIHYLDDCSKCFCTGQANCPGADPFN